MQDAICQLFEISNSEWQMYYALKVWKKMKQER